MAVALLGKCVGLLALLVVFYTGCYGFRVRDVVTQSSSETSPQSPPTCNSLFGKCTERSEKTMTYSFPKKKYEPGGLRNTKPQESSEENVENTVQYFKNKPLRKGESSDQDDEDDEVQVEVEEESGETWDSKAEDEPSVNDDDEEVSVSKTEEDDDDDDDDDHDDEDDDDEELECDEVTTTPSPMKFEKVRHADKAKSVEVLKIDKKPVEQKNDDKIQEKENIVPKKVKKVAKIEKSDNDINKLDKKKTETENEEPPKPKSVPNKIKEKVTKNEKINKKSEKSTGSKSKKIANRIAETTNTLSNLNDDILHVPTFVPNFTAVEDPICQQHGKIFLRQLRGHKLWALQMLDSSAKVPSGLLRGNINQFGDFDQCLGISARVKIDDKTVKIQGKYCLATVDFYATMPDMKLPVNLMQGRALIRGQMNDPGHFIPKFTSANWALCIPAACSVEDAEKTLQRALDHYNVSTGIRFNVDVDKNMCYVKNTTYNFSKETIGVLYFYAMITCLVIVATVRDYLVMSQEKGNYSERIIMSFSLRRTLKVLFKHDESGNDILCIHGIRSLATIALYIAHQLIPISRFPFANRASLTEVANHPISSILRSSLVYTDGFLLLSGVLTAYNMTKELNNRNEIRWFCRFIARYIRLTPALLVTVFWYAFVMEHIGSGPQWNNVIMTNAELCKNNAWTNLLYVQNFFPFEEMCATHTHQLALDMQLSLIAPILVFLLHSKPIVGVIIVFFLIQLSATLRYIATANNNLSLVIFHGMSLKHLYKTANLTYVLSLHRATPYVFGISLGVLLYHTGKNVKIHKVFVIFGWFLATALGLWSLFSPWRMARRDYVYDVEDAIQYAVISPISWALALCWTIFACFTDYGGIVNKILSSYGLIVFSRLSYAVYLTQFAVFFYNVGITRYSKEFQFFRAIDLVEATIVLLVSLVLTLFFDLPMQEAKTVIMECTDEKSSPEIQDEKVTKESPTTKPNSRSSDTRKRSFLEQNDERVERNSEDSDRIYLKNQYDESPRREKRSVSRGRRLVPYEDDVEKRSQSRNRRLSSNYDDEEDNLLIRQHEKRPLSRNKLLYEEDSYLRNTRSGSQGRSFAKEVEIPREILIRQRSLSADPEIRGPSIDKEQEIRRILSSESEEEYSKFPQRRSKFERKRPPSSERILRPNDEEDWERELRIRRKQFQDNLALQQEPRKSLLEDKEELKPEEENEEDVMFIRRRSSAEGKIALLKDPTENDNMDSWTEKVASPSVSGLGTSYEKSETEDELSFYQRREYREKAPPFPEELPRDRDERSNFDFSLKLDSKRISVQDLSKLDDNSDWEENEDRQQVQQQSLKPTGQGLYKRESIIKSQASEEDPEFVLPERPKLVEQEQEHPFKKAWQEQKSRSEEDSYLVKDLQLSINRSPKDSSPQEDSIGEESTDVGSFLTENTELPLIWQYRSSSLDVNMPSSISETDEDASSNREMSEKEDRYDADNDDKDDANNNKEISRTKSDDTNWDYEQDET